MLLLLGRVCLKKAIAITSTLGWSGPGSVIQDHSDHVALKEPMNLWSKWIHRLLLCAMIRMILDHWPWSRSPQRNAPMYLSYYTPLPYLCSTKYIQNCNNNLIYIPVHYKAMVISEVLMHLVIANTAPTSKEFHLSISSNIHMLIKPLLVYIYTYISLYTRLMLTSMASTTLEMSLCCLLLDNPKALSTCFSCLKLWV